MEDPDEDAGFETFIDDMVVITSVCALVLCSNYFAGDFIRPLEILGKDVRVRANVARRLRELGTDVDRKTHFAFKHRRDGVKPVDSDGVKRYA